MEIRRAANSISAAKGSLSEPERLNQLIDAHWEWTLEERPEYATQVGVRSHDHRWTDFSPEAFEKRKDDLKEQLAALETIDAASLDPHDELNRALLEDDITQWLEGTKYPSEYMPIGPMGGPHSNVAQILDLMPASSSEDFDNLISRLEGIPTVLKQSIELMRLGIESGITVPKVVMRNAVDQISSQIVDPKDSPLLRKFNGDGGKAETFFAEKIRPSLESYRDFVADIYIPACRDSTALFELPNGEAWYEYMVRRMTTTDLSPKEIHEIGLSEVERIRSEMEKVKEESGFAGPLSEFFEFLRTDKQFFYEDPEELLRDYRDICKRADPELARLFGTLPRLPYGVLPVPSYIEKTTTTAYYQRGSPEAGRAGYFFANTYDLRSRPKWEMEALTLHEAVPGHHLQIALAQELELPPFRRHRLQTAYTEGWGLYAESLGSEMGFYRDPNSLFGRLTYEMWRAIRLVVDTGMHALGWGREKAIEFFANNAGKAKHDIVVEIDRYIYWPGQALAYKIGELKIKELRARAESKLGASFDIRMFHDELLKRAALPLDLLERFIDDWIDQGL